MNLLIIESAAKEYEKKIRSKFSQVVTFAATKEEEVGDFIEKADILLAFRISDGIRSGSSVWEPSELSLPESARPSP